MQALLEAGADPDARLTRHPWYMVYSGCGNRNCGLVDTEGGDPILARRLRHGSCRRCACWWSTARIRTFRPRPRRRAGRGAAPRPGTTTIPIRWRRCPPRPACGWRRTSPRWAPTRRDSHRTRRATPGCTPIHAASGVGYGEGFAGNAHRHAPDAWLAAVEYLVELGADVNRRDHNGYNAVHHAAARGDDELILYLVEQGADVTAVSRRGQTTADMANGPVQRVSPIPATVALLERLGSKNNHNCVSC